MNTVRKMESPPKSRLAVRVGVTGHRPGGLDRAETESLRASVSEVLKHVKDVAVEVKASYNRYYSDGGQPLLRVMSPLAEGADMLVAEEGLAEGYELQCVLPFERAEYEKDFKDGSIESYRTLLGKASSVLELNGSRATQDLENEAYQTVGRMVLAQSDVLIAIWDGEDEKGKGGTGQIVRESLISEIPVVWISSVSPHEIRVLLGGGYEGFKEAGLRELDLRLKRVLKPHHANRADLSLTYFEEKQPARTWGFVFEIFCDLFSGERIDTGGSKVRDFYEETEEEWRSVWDSCPGIPEQVKGEINEKFLMHYAWADKLANYYSNIYRSSFTLNYLMASLAVLFALLVPTVKKLDTLWIICELTLIVLIIAITAVGNLNRWHERWIDYRLLSEQLRQLRFLAPLGLTTPSFRVPAHDTYGDPRSTWVNWHFRAIVREAGMVGAVIDGQYLASYRDFLSKQEIAGQIGYHQRNSPRFRKINHTLHIIGMGLFALTFITTFMHLFYHTDMLTLCSAFFPALGAAIYGIRTQGEFEQIAKRSDAMSAHLENLRNELERPDFVPSFKHLGGIAESTAEVMSSETLDWRIVFQSKRLVLPG